ncbi:MAG: glycosyltransferase family 4 protein [Parcubacteria group bacterium]|nr:glycosyltransferase family 4 protein [Parcubacteria group bacterium]
MKILREIKYTDIVHLHAFPHSHNFIAYFIAKIYAKKVVITPHFHPEHPYYERKSNYWLLEKCDAVFAITDYEKEYFIKKGLNKNKIFIAPNAIDPRSYIPQNLSAFKMTFRDRHNIKDGEKIILFIGRKIEYKNVDILVKAVIELKKEVYVKLFLIGPNFDWFGKFYSQLSREEREYIIDLGIISHQEKVNLLYLSDLLVLPSQFEAFGIVFLEAWICKIPVIGTKNGAIPNVIGESGLTAICGDVKDLKENIKSLLVNSSLAETMAVSGRNKVLDKYNWDRVGAKVLDVYL